MSNIVRFEHLPHEICRVTSEFGCRTNPITGVKGTFHQGLDIGAKKAGVEGDKLFAVADGIMVYTAFMASKEYGYGYFIIIQHKGFCTLYAHMKGLIVSVNDDVKAGQVIGYMGSTGASTAAHLHFEVEPIQFINYQHYITKSNGIRKYAVDPYKFIKEFRERQEEDEEMANGVVRYKNISEMPVHYQAAVKDLVDRGIIKGNASGDLNMTEDMIRTLIMADRMDKQKR